MSPGTAEGDGDIPAGRDARTDVCVRRVPPASSVWTRDHRRVVSVARRIGAGVVWINCHMTTGRRDAQRRLRRVGYGKDLSAYGLEDYARVHHVMAYTGT
ncbi:aldehyde dehydrogenase family protein [Streptomyces sp. NPDC018347]|uniref:aldehyde dehydrogenase family protein n=1 Tax=Streptomyces sp. NPDC018347 TaxID=3157193 RepID=UPI0033DB6B6D